MRALRTARLLLTPQIAAHAASMFLVLSDPALYEYENEPPASVEWLRDRFAKLESRRSADGNEQWLNWILCLDGSGEAIGYVQATVGPDATAAIAYVLGSRYWGQGLASEAVGAMMEELASGYGVRVFFAVFKEKNVRSRRLLERLGFVDASGEQVARIRVEPDERLMTRNT